MWWAGFKAMSARADTRFATALRNLLPIFFTQQMQGRRVKVGRVPHVRDCAPLSVRPETSGGQGTAHPT